MKHTCTAWFRSSLARRTGRGAGRAGSRGCDVTTWRSSERDTGEGSGWGEALRDMTWFMITHKKKWKKYMYM